MPFREGYETLAAAAPQKMPWDILQEAAGASGAGPQQVRINVFQRLANGNPAVIQRLCNGCSIEVVHT
jgi:hypothetical protein